jgi:hypothetical protein
MHWVFFSMFNKWAYFITKLYYFFNCLHNFFWMPLVYLSPSLLCFVTFCVWLVVFMLSSCFPWSFLVDYVKFLNLEMIFSPLKSWRFIQSLPQLIIWWSDFKSTLYGATWRHFISSIAVLFCYLKISSKLMELVSCIFL